MTENIDDGSNDLIVALPELTLIRHTFETAGANLVADSEVSTSLGLAKIRLADLDAAGQALDAWCDERTGGSTAPLNGYAQPTESGLDRILWDLRAGFAARNGGWMPTMGKNRMVGRLPGMRNQNPGLQGADAISHGGGGVPKALDHTPTWAAERTGPEGKGVRIGVLDTAVRDQRYLLGAWTGPVSSNHDGSDPPPAEAGHGTFVAGLILRRAPAATLVTGRLLDDNGAAISSWRAAQMIVDVGNSGVDILNMSFVCYTADGIPPLVLSAAIDRLEPEIVVVAAAGNHGYLPVDEKSKPAFPAALDDVIAVGAATARDATAAVFTPPGPWVDVLARGEDLESTYLDEARVWDDSNEYPDDLPRIVECFDGYASWSGTSFSAALITGEIARNTVPGEKPPRKALEELLARARPAYTGTLEMVRPVFVDIEGLP
jgi:membrane-anchored mycosin MYCP